MSAERAGAAAVVVATYTYRDGSKLTRYYGPFMPHIGSAMTSFAASLEGDADARADVVWLDLAYETVFIGEGESDAAVVAVR